MRGEAVSLDTKIFAKGSRYWSETKIYQDPVSLQKAYESGLAGVWRNPEANARLREYNKQLTGYGSIEEAAHGNGWADSGAGKLVIPFVHVMLAYPGCWPGPAQEVGDCVSHDTKNAVLGSMVCEVVSGKPDEVSGLTEGLPEVSPDGIRNGVLSTEAIYWWRRHSGDGWSCGEACEVIQKESGLWVRKNYEDLGIDLTEYSGNLAHKYGSNPPTGKIAESGKLHLARAFAEAKSNEEKRDALANGYFLSTCGGESYEKTRDKYGFSKQTREGWSHAMAYVAWDDRPEIVKVFGEPLALDLNSWNEWNSGPRDIWDSAKYVPSSQRDLWVKCDIVNPTTGNIMIPKGSMWVLASTSRQRDCWAISSVNGWPRKKLPDWGGSLFG